jgi:hypothetical protein
MIPIYDNAEENIVMRLWFLDTGDSECMGIHGYDCVRPDQIEWFRAENAKIPDDDPSKGKGILFMHIPMVDYINVFNDYEFYGHAQDFIGCWAVDTGLFSAVIEQPTVEWITCGHDHNNDWHGLYNGIWMSYGRKTGFGSYGPAWPMQHGARVFEMTQEPWKMESWIREGDGQIKKEVEPKSRRDTQEPYRECWVIETTGYVKFDSEEWLFFKEHYMKRPDLIDQIPPEFM